MEDGQAVASVATGISTWNGDVPYVLWDGMGGQPQGRSGRQYTRLTRFNLGDQVRLFIYTSGQFMTKSQIDGQFLSIIRIAD